MKRSRRDLAIPPLNTFGTQPHDVVCKQLVRSVFVRSSDVVGAKVSCASLRASSALTALFDFAHQIVTLQSDRDQKVLSFLEYISQIRIE
jgi:hypothetical protein